MERLRFTQSLRPRIRAHSVLPAFRIEPEGHRVAANACAEATAPPFHRELEPDIAGQRVLALFDWPDVLPQHVRLVPRRHPDPPLGHAALGCARDHAGPQRMAGEVARLKA